MNKNISIVHFLIITLLLGIFIFTNFEYLHWKTFYQALLAQVFLSVVLFYYRHKKESAQNLFFLNYLGLFYFILISSWIVSSTTYFYKLGRYFYSPDVFKYFVILIPLIYFREVRRSELEKPFISRFFLISIMLLGSISFSFLYSEIPEICIFLGLPLILTSPKSFLDLSIHIRFLLVSIFLFILAHTFYGYNSFSTLTYLSLFFLGFTILIYSEEIPVIYFIIILFINFFNIFVYQIYNLGGFSLLMKNPSPLLNSNRISGYNSLFLIFLISSWNKSILHHKKVLVGWIFFLCFFIFFNLFQYSRGGIVSIFFGIVAFILLQKSTKNAYYKYLYYIFIIISLSFTLLPFVILFLHKSNIINIYSLDAFTSGRFELWYQFFEIYSKFPLSEKLFGLGLGEHNFFLNFLPLKIGEVTMNFVTQADGTFIHTHNLFYTILFYYGGFGFLFFFLITMKIVFKIRTLILDNPKKLPYSIALIIFLIHNSFDSLLDTASILILLAYFLSFLIKRTESIKLIRFKNILTISFSILFIIVLGIRAFQWNEYHKKETFQKFFWKETLDCKFAHIPNMEKLPIINAYAEDTDFLLFPKQRKSQENLLYNYFHWKKYPSSQNYSYLMRTWQICKTHHFKAYLCEYLSPKAEYGNIFQKWDSRFWIADKFKPCFESNHENIEE